jgi:hypothetical protein
MEYEPDLPPAPECFRCLFTGQALAHLDEIVMAWRTGDHPITWRGSSASFEIRLLSGLAVLFKLHAPDENQSARIEVDIYESSMGGIPHELTEKLWCELATIGQETENTHAPLVVPLANFSRGDRKVFLAYALTIARNIAVAREDFEKSDSE